jgi:predicted transposase/invertase (TIGR01784 family)
MLEIAVRKERKRYFNEGKREAERKSRREIARTMIAKGFETALIAEITGLSEAELRKLGHEMKEQ